MTELKKYREPLNRELLCIADTYWVLGHWYIKCMLNGRSLADFNALSGFAQDTLGNTRAIFSYLEEADGLPEHQLEFGRSDLEIHSTSALDEPPSNWSDFVLTAYLAETALWKVIQTMQSDAFPEIKVLLTRFGEALYYREMYLEGWIDDFSQPEREESIRILPKRLNELTNWFDGMTPDSLIDGKIRTMSLADARSRWANKIRPALESATGGPWQGVQPGGALPADWHAGMRRPRRPIPAGLWEFMVPSSEEALMARRPLAVSVTDNLDLFPREA